ncbi:unnamed protein product [Moneuplotes crassus]|uniref:PPM-type phosphatase domain-containing protein n=1 Tax=Euplotes crassus TaxID=5936 RepID=A0AAD1YA11_EUPCR|nr:unnamed protein product [Moneuplotes crassus]
MDSDRMMQDRRLTSLSPKKVLIPKKYFNNQPINDEYYTIKENRGINFTRRSPSVGILKKNIQFQGSNLAPIKSPNLFRNQVKLGHTTSQSFQRSSILTSKDKREEQKMSASNGFLEKKKKLGELNIKAQNLLTPSESTRNINNRYENSGLNPVGAPQYPRATFDSRKKKWNNTELIQSINKLIRENSNKNKSIHQSIRDKQRIKERIRQQSKDLNLQNVLNGYKCITKESPKLGKPCEAIKNHLKHLRSVRSMDRDSIISKNMPDASSIHMRKSLEPLQLDRNESDSDETSSKNHNLMFAKMTKTGYIPMIPETRFRKKQNQDSAIVLQNFMGMKDNYFFGVFDGHGTNGAKVSGFLKEVIPGGIKRAYQRSCVSPTIDSSINFKTMTSWFTDKKNKTPQLDNYQNLKLRSRMIEESMDYTQTELKNQNIDIKFSGSTANICLLGPDNILTCANVGDSRSILIKCHKEGTQEEVWSCKPLSRDHKPDLTDEKSRIISNGGRVACYKDAKKKSVGPQRVWLKNNQIPGLAMSRSFGDEVARCAGVIHKPEIQHFSLTPEDKAIVLASDGVWEFLSNKQVTKLLVNSIKCHKPKKGCERVVGESTRLWKLKDSIIDDITLITVILPDIKEPETKEKGLHSSLSLNRLSSC